MNHKNLDLILEQYVSRFEELNARDGDDEGYKWRAETCFKANWDINTDDFSEMYQAAMKEAGSLIDNAAEQPVEGIRMLLSHEEEVETVRQCFRDLYIKDDGNLSARQQRIDIFRDKINACISRYEGESGKYFQTMNSVIYYLNLWQPEENYIFKSAEATAWAGCLEFEDDFGSGSSFSLEKYYRMCDELLEELENYEDLLALNTRRMEEQADGFDDELHILVYDIIYCAYSYDFYAGMDIPVFSAKERMQKAENQQEIKRLEETLVCMEQELAELAEEQVTFPDMTGNSVSHKKFGEGVVAVCEDGKLKVDFSGMEKLFQYPQVFQQGFLACQDEEAMALFEKNAETEKRKDNLQKEMLLTRMKLQGLRG